MAFIELSGITKTYHLEKLDVPVLHGIDLTIDQGEFVVIMGHSGSGKSTLLHLLGLLDKPTGGSYRLAGREVASLGDDDLADVRNRMMGFVFQQFNLLARVTARDNVALPLIYAHGHGDPARALSLLEQVGLADRVLHRPNELSGGQQQRVAIARALVNEPLVIFADEPTGNLDSASTADIIRILQDLNSRGITIVMVTHEPDLAGVASRVIRIADGKIIADELRAAHPPCADCPPPQTARHAVAGFSRIRDYFAQAMRALVGNPTRSLLSILGVLIGVASLIAMMALGTGAQEQVKKSISSLGTNLLIVRASSPMRGGIALDTGAPTRFTIQDAEAIRERVPGVDKVAAYVSGRGQATYGGKNWNTRVEGTTADYPALRNSSPDRGRFFTDEEAVMRARVAVIGQTVVTQLFGDEDPLGKYIRIRRVDFQVIGIFPVKGSSGFRDEDDRIMVPLNTAMYRLLGREYVDYMDVKVGDANVMDDVAERITALLVSLHRLSPSRADSIEVRNMADVQETITSTIKAFSFLLGGIAFISLLVGGIGIMNIMLVSVSERTREIGLRKAIGATNRDILMQFVIEAVTICVLGGVCGILFGSAVSLGLGKFAGWSTRIAPASVALAFIFSVLIGLIFGVWPARTASRLNPIEALRSE